ncbi:hypothetical protein [Chryseobacterium sp. ISL-6]|uniref:hypothetical protein n=1 Tax=Chryseobacterium sp. ISL-6 TaxID=2819143 RepID=UPI001BE8B3CE|nr:hypothetical protein [Chryseobacterium sp. ISL-6]MBT2620144.1 hypothetical protein [Chryseobacterium sp. ISL-6]
MGCSTSGNFVRYSRSYVEVGKIMDSVHLPYIIDLEQGDKHLIAMGVSHTYNDNDPQISEIKQTYLQFKPDITINEGGQITKKFDSEKEAVEQNGEVGLLKYLSDIDHKPLMNGDIEDSLEFKLMLKKYSKEDLLLYYIMERLVIPHLNGAYGNKTIEELYTKAIQKWFIQEGFPVDKELQNFEGYKKLYQSKMGHPFQLSMNPDIELFDYVNPNCTYCTIGRNSKILRDSILLEKISSELKTHGKVMVAFGHGHILAIEPALKKMMKKL